MNGDQLTGGCAMILRRQPTRMVEGSPEGGYTDMFEIVCRDCGDHPSLGYCEVPPRLQRIRGPYPMAIGVVAYEQHFKLHEQLASARQGSD